VTRRQTRLGLLLAAALLAGSCAAGQAFRRGDAAMRAGDLDRAVTQFRTAVQAAPDNANYKIALQRAMQAASRAHLERAREYEDKDQLEAALSEYRLATEYEPSNRLAAAKVAALDRTIRDRIEAARPKPPIEAMRERVRAANPEPFLNPASRVPLNMHLNSSSLKEILTTISTITGINIIYDREFTDHAAQVNLDGVTLEEALSQILSTNQLSYKIINPRAILVFNDSLPKHQQYDDQVVKTVYLSNADPTELQAMLSNIIRFTGMAIQPAIGINKSANSITLRGTPNVVAILEKVIQQNDKPRAEIVIDVEILEVNSQRARTYGLNLTQYAVGGIFSPEVSPSATTTGTTPGTPTTTTTGRSTAPQSVGSPPAFNLNTISQGVSTTDFYLAVPAAVVNFLESDNHTRLLAKPQLRGAEGTKLTLKLGTSFPVISTSYQPIATGGAGTNPLNSYSYKDLGINIDMTPRVTLEGDVQLVLTVDDTSFGGNVTIAGQEYPQFNQRTVTTTLRLRDGESNLLAGLLQQNDTNGVTGFPGAIHVPLLRQLFSNNSITGSQDDIVMLLTPHIIRTSGITEEDLKPIYIGSQGVAGATLGIGGPPPLIQPPPETPPAAAPAVGQFTTPSGVVVKPPAGSSPVPGMVVVPSPTPTPSPTPAPTVTTLLPETPPVAAAAAPPSPTPTPAPAPTAEAPLTSTGVGSAQIILSPPSTTFRVGGGPYTVPISVVGATRLSTITLTLTFDPSILRVRMVQEGSFMRTGGAAAAFTQQVNGGRIDITISRGANAAGATGTGVLAAILFDAVAPGSVTLTVSGAATGPGGTTMGLQFRPVTITVQ
jgi:general secretion pathway protein D